jgi:hypothetical protein
VINDVRAALSGDGKEETPTDEVVAEIVVALYGTLPAGLNTLNG